MNRIFKYPMDITDFQEIELPIWGTILNVINQNEQIVLYAIVDDELLDKTVPHKFRIVGTGHPFPDTRNWSYLNTLVFADGKLIWHVFVEKN